MSAAETKKPVVAAFDFDGTITYRETLGPFLVHTLGATRVARDALVLSPTLTGYALGLIRNDIAKERVFVRCLGGMQMDVLRERAELFAATGLPRLIRQEALRRLGWHKRHGHRCVVISASLELYVKPWAISAGFDDVIATHIEILPDGRTTGRLAGPNCFGIEKVRQLEALLGGRSRYTLYAYGDSRGDKELLAAADHGYYQKMPSEEHENSD